jgi:hypothetical protein
LRRVIINGDPMTSGKHQRKRTWWVNAAIDNIRIEEEMNAVTRLIGMLLHLVNDLTISIMKLPQSKDKDNACLAKHEMNAIHANTQLD